MKVTHVRSVELSAPDVTAVHRFYVDEWGLRDVASVDGRRYLRGAGADHHVVVLRQEAQARIVGYTLGVAAPAEVDRLAEAVSERRGVVVSPPAPLDQPGGGYGMTIADPDGRLVTVSAGVDDLAPAPSADGRVVPLKISHVVLNSPRHDEQQAFLTEVLGFVVADSMPHMTFFRCNADHHSVAITRAPHASLNHIAFEVGGVDEVLRGIDEVDAPMIWGPNRHGPGNNVFGYFTAPNGQVVEYTAEIEQIDPADPPAPREWLPGDATVVDAWANAETLRPTEAARSLMLGDPEPASAPALHAGESQPDESGPDESWRNRATDQ